MLTQARKKPEIFSHLSDDAYYFDVTFLGSQCAHVAVEHNGDVGYIHIEVAKWTRDFGKTIVQDFLELKDFLVQHGIHKLVATNENLEDEVRWAKFIELFGFPEPDTVLVSMREI